MLMRADMARRKERRGRGWEREEEQRTRRRLQGRRGEYPWELACVLFALPFPSPHHLITPLKLLFHLTRCKSQPQTLPVGGHRAGHSPESPCASSQRAVVANKRHAVVFARDAVLRASEMNVAPTRDAFCHGSSHHSPSCSLCRS